MIQCCMCPQVLVAFSIDTDALGLLSRCAKCNGEFENRWDYTVACGAIETHGWPQPVPC